MDHVVYVDFKAKELKLILEGSKTMIIRGAMGRKLPYGRVYEGDVLYFIENNAEGLIRAKGIVNEVLNSEKLTEEDSAALINSHQEQLKLTNTQVKRWKGKRFLVLISISQVETVEPFGINKSAFGNMDDWLPVENIQSVL